MQVDLISEIWGELKRYINTVERSEAAESMIATMIEHDCDPDDIRAAFVHDSEVKRALSDYLGQVSGEEEEEEEEEDYDSDYDEDY